MNCGTCKHWNLSGSLGQHDYGKCDARPEGALKQALSTGAQNVCRLGKFEKADPKVVRRRELAGGSLL